MSNFVYEFRFRRVRRSVAGCKVEPYGQLSDSRGVASLLNRLTFDADREEFYAVYLDIRNTIVGYELVFRGTLTGVSVHPREVFRGALLAGAAAIIVGHNHPSGDAHPSPEDRALTTNLRGAGELLGIPVLDHVIVAADNPNHFSFGEEGL